MAVEKNVCFPEYLVAAHRGVIRGTSWAFKLASVRLTCWASISFGCSFHSLAVVLGLPAVEAVHLALRAPTSCSGQATTINSSRNSSMGARDHDQASQLKRGCASVTLACPT